MFLSPQRDLSVRRRNRVRPWLEMLERREVLNGAPVITGPTSVTSAEGDTVSVAIQFSDPEGDNVIFMSSGPAAGIQFDGSTGVYSGTFDYDDAGTYTVDVWAYDEGSWETVHYSFTWTVTDTNRPPEITGYGEPEDWYFVEGDEVNIALYATDPDGDTVSFDATGLPPGLTVEEDEYYPGTWYITGTVEAHGDTDPIKIYEMEITASDGMDEDAVSPFCQATDFRVTSVAITVPEGGLTASTTGTQISVVISGTGAPPAGATGREISYLVFDQDPTVESTLQSYVNPAIIVHRTNADGTWSITRSFTLTNNNGHVVGPNGGSAEAAPEIKVRVRWFVNNLPQTITSAGAIVTAVN